MVLRAFPVLYARDVDGLAGFYGAFGFAVSNQMAGEDGTTGFVNLARDGVEMAITTEAAPRMLAGVEPGPGPRHELFVYVPDVDEAVRAATDAGASTLRPPADMPWGERVAYLRDPKATSSPSRPRPPSTPALRRREGAGLARRHAQAELQLVPDLTRPGPGRVRDARPTRWPIARHSQPDRPRVANVVRQVGRSAFTTRAQPGRTDAAARRDAHRNTLRDELPMPPL